MEALKSFSRVPWTSVEKSLLRDMWETGATWEALRTAFPGRSDAAIRKYVGYLGARRDARKGFLSDPDAVPETFWCWFAGFVDGEGSICWSRDKRYDLVVPRLTISNTHFSTMRYIVATLGLGAFSTHAGNKRHKDQIMFSVNRPAHLAAVLLKLEPHLVTKREQAQCMLAYLKTGEYEHLYKIRELNKRGMDG